MGLGAAAAALEERKAWNATASLHAETQRGMLLASREETAVATNLNREIHEQRHQLELESMSSAHEAGAKAAEEHAEQLAKLLTAKARAALEDGKSQGVGRLLEFQDAELKQQRKDRADGRRWNQQAKLEDRAEQRRRNEAIAAATSDPGNQRLSLAAVVAPAQEEEQQQQHELLQEQQQKQQQQNQQ